MTTTRTIAGLKFEVHSPSAYLLCGWRERIFIIYLSGTVPVEKEGWYVCLTTRDGHQLQYRSKFPHKTVDEAAAKLHRVLRLVGQMDTRA